MRARRNEVNNVYVMSDVHGFFSKFVKMLKLIHFDKFDQLLILGNVIDYGPQPIELLQFIMNNENMRMAIGKHEITMLAALDKNDLSIFHLWTNELGGAVTFENYQKLSEQEQFQIRNFLREECMRFFISDNYFLIPSPPMIYDQNEEKNIKTSDDKKDAEEMIKKLKSGETTDIIDDIMFYTKPAFKDKTTIFGYKNS